MRLFFKIFKWFIAGASLIVFISSLTFFVYLRGGCSYKDSMTKIKSLPKGRLNDLFISMKKLESGTNENALEGFQELDYKHIDLMSDVIVLGGCFDNKAMLKFNGLGNQGDLNQSIVLSYGEYPLKIETLWER